MPSKNMAIEGVFIKDSLIIGHEKLEVVEYIIMVGYYFFCLSETKNKKKPLKTITANPFQYLEFFVKHKKKKINGTHRVRDKTTKKLHRMNMIQETTRHYTKHLKQSPAH